MQYDPIKRTLGTVFNQSPWLRILFYRMLDLLLLRTWHVKKALRRWRKQLAVGSGQLADDDRHPASGIGHPSILDAGSGFGQYSFFLSRMLPDAQIDAVDVKEEQIEDCTRFFNRTGRSNVHFAIADLTTYVRNDRYDLILSVDVMEHILEDELVFSNFFQSLKPGGMLLISTPSDQGGSDVHDHGHEESFIDEHVRDGYNIMEIREKLKRAGFDRTEAHFTYGWPGRMGWRLSMKYPIKLLNTSKLFFILLPFYYLLTFPVALVCNWLDLRGNHATGTGLIVRAWKGG